MGLFSRHKPKINFEQSKKGDGYSGWLKCDGCHELIHQKDLAANLSCCPKCDHHFRVSAKQRVEHLVDPDSFKELFNDIHPTDPLKFVDSQKYDARLKAAQKKSGRIEGAMVGTARLKEQMIALGVMDFSFMGGSMGSVVGERITRLIEHSLEHELPLIIVSASGGARMQESIFSLMQMAKTSAALAKLHEKGIPFLSVLTNPTSGGVTASFASLGDVIIAEPKALICFAGPRVIEQVIQHKLPPDAQKSEFLLKHGLIDCITPRKELREMLAKFVAYLSGNKGQPQKKQQETDTIDSLANLSGPLEELIRLSHGTKK